MKTKQITYRQTEVELISQLSQFIGQNPHHLGDGIVNWEIGMEGEGIFINFEEKEIGFVDCNIDTKTYFSIVGYGTCMGYKIEDYFIEK